MRNRAWIAAMGMAGAACVVMVEAQAQQPKITHAQLSTRAGDSLQREIAVAQTSTWIGSPVATKHRVNSGWDGVDHLEGTNSDDMYTSTQPNEPIPPAAILMRVTAGKVERVQIESMDREIDAG